MIASNYRKHPAALALQLPLPFPRRLVWALPRPDARILRAIRVARGRAFEAAGRIRYPQKPATPQWWKDAKRRARQLADQVRNACMNLVAEVRVAVTTADTELLGFNYENEIAKAKAQNNRYRVNALKRAAERQRVAKIVKDGTIQYEPGCPRCDQHTVRLATSRKGWLQCINCTASWDPAHYDQARRELNEPDDDD